MSKNMTRKGLAFGAMVALGSTLFAGAPASADANGPITLLPNGGTSSKATFNSITGAGITLDAVLDPRLNLVTANPSDGVDVASKAKYIILNPSGAELVINLSAAPTTQGFSTFSASTGYATAVGTTDVTSGAASVAAAKAAGLEYVDYTAYNAGTNEYVTNSKKIAINAGIVDAGSNGDSDDTIASLTVDTTSTASVSITVQVLTDTDVTANTGLGVKNSFENVSKAETVNLYPASAVTATTTIDTLARSVANPALAADALFKAKVVYGSSVNPFAVAANTTVSLFKDGSATALSLSPDNTATGGTATRFTAVSAATLYASGWNVNAGDTALANFAAGIYSAQAYFNATGSTNYVRMGAASPVVDLNNGLIADIATTDAYAVENANVDFASNAMAVRVGTTTAVVVAKSRTAGPADIEKSGIRYRATVTAVELSATSTTSVSGSATSLVEADDEVVVYATSDSTGKVSFTLTNAGAKKDDEITVAVESLKTDGTWTTADTVTVKWANATLTKFAASPGNYISGANPTLVFKATDQFGQPISTTSTGKLSVTVVAKIGGVADKTKLSDTKTLENGQASFTFANFATAAIPGQVEATLYEGTTSSTAVTNPVVVNVYNTSATNKVTVLDSYTADITYVDYVVGDETAADVAAKIELTGITSAAGATITGSVQNASGVGQPGAEVVVSSTGVLFYDAAQGIYAQDKITVYANEYGTYSVKAISHKVAPAGQTVTLTSGGKSATTLLKTYFPVNVLNANNLNLTWDLPALMVKNTTYALTATLTDKWGNPVQTVGTDGSIWFTGTGAVQVNGVETAVKKNFDKNGKATVFVRSIKDIAGPGSINAELKIEANQYAVDPAAAVGANGAESAGFDRFTSLTSVVTDVKSTAWDETKFSSTLSAVVDIKDVAPVTGKVNVGSFNGKLVVYASGLNGATISWKVGGTWGKQVATSNYAVFNRPTPRAGVTVSVEIYVNGVKTLTKSVVTR